jgi:hypothetical protein
MGATLATSNIRTIPDDRLRLAAQHFKVFKSKVKQLRNVLREHHLNLVRTEASRDKVVKALTEVSVESPMFDLVGGPPESALTHALSSYAAVHTDCSREMATHLAEFQDEMINYVTDWESTVTTRIATELRHVDKLFKEFVRYHNKLEALKASAEKKKAVKDADLARITRNESKLRTAKKEYRRNLVSVTLLTEEVTERGWKDLVPLMIKMIDYDVESSNKTVELFNKLIQLQKEMVTLGERFEMDAEDILNGRLAVLMEEDAMEFVRAEHLADIESIQPSVSTYVPPSGGPLRSSARGAARHAPSESEYSENDSLGHINDENGPERAPRPSHAQRNPKVAAATKPRAPLDSSPYDERISANRKSRPPADEGIEVEEEASVKNYPTSIYLKFDGTTNMPVLDDETTLTDYHGMVSI